MSRLSALARENGWAQVLSRGCISALRRFRDSFTARKLGAPGFRAGHAPRLLGLSHMRIGRNLHAGDGLWLDAITTYAGESFTPVLHIGDNVSLSDRVHIACLDRITIGSGTLIGSHVLISDHSHGLYRGGPQTEPQTRLQTELQSGPETVPAERPLRSTGAIVIGRNVWIGDGVAILGGATIGDGAVIGANSVVTGSIPASTIAVGAPARPTRHWNSTQRQWLPLP